MKVAGQVKMHRNATSTCNAVARHIQLMPTLNPNSTFMHFTFRTRPHPQYFRAVQRSESYEQIHFTPHVTYRCFLLHYTLLSTGSIMLGTTMWHRGSKTPRSSYSIQASHILRHGFGYMTWSSAGFENLLTHY